MADGEDARDGADRLAPVLADALRRANAGPYKERRAPGAWSPEACEVWREGGDVARLLYAALCLELKTRRHVRDSDISRVMEHAQRINESTAQARTSAAQDRETP